MEKEANQDHEHKMCDWCGNQYGRKYSWMRLIVAIVIGLFIFSAGYHLGELNVLVHSQYGQVSGMMYGGHGDRIHSDWNQPMMQIEEVVPATPTTPAGNTTITPVRQ